MRSARPRRCPDADKTKAGRGGTFDTLHRQPPGAMSEAAGRVADSTGNWVDSRAPGLGAPLSAARPPRPSDRLLAAAAALLVVPGAGRRARRGSDQPLARGCCSSSAPSPCAAPAAPGTTSSIAISTRGSNARARGRFPPARSACAAPPCFSLLQALVGLAVLLQFNRFTIMVGLASLAVVAIYPFMKRVTYWPQIVLGLAFSWGALMGWPATFGRLDLPALLLYAGAISWVIGYDTIYAHQDREDDAFIGIKSTALLFGARTKPMLAIFFTPRGDADRMGRLERGRRHRLRARAAGLRGASGVADRAPRHRRSGALPRSVQVEPRRRPDPVRRARARCGGRAISIARDDLALAAVHGRLRRAGGRACAAGRSTAAAP